VTTTTTTTILRPFIRDYPGEPVPEETLTHPPSWSTSNLYQLLPPTTIHSILRLNYMLRNLFAQPLSMSSLVYLSVWSPPPHIPYISSPNQCLLFATTDWPSDMNMTKIKKNITQHSEFQNYVHALAVIVTNDPNKCLEVNSDVTKLSEIKTQTTDNYITITSLIWQR